MKSVGAFALGAVMAAVVVGGVAVAQSSEPETISVCVQGGLLRTTDDLTCPGNGELLTWNIEGPQGPAGPPGPPGVADEPCRVDLDSILIVEPAYPVVGPSTFTYEFTMTNRGDLPAALWQMAFWPYDPSGQLTPFPQEIQFRSPDFVGYTPAEFLAVGESRTISVPFTTSGLAPGTYDEFVTVLVDEFCDTGAI